MVILGYIVSSRLAWVTLLYQLSKAPIPLACVEAHVTCQVPYGGWVAEKRGDPQWLWEAAD